MGTEHAHGRPQAADEADGDEFDDGDRGRLSLELSVESSFSTTGATGLKPPPDLPVSMSAADAVREYYEALRRGEPLYPYFVEDNDVVKFGVSETLAGYDAVAEGLREQSRATSDWTVESGDLRALEFGDAASFADSVRLAWTDVESGERVTHDTRWSGTLVRRDEEWLFAGMHVSVAET